LKYLIEATLLAAGRPVTTQQLLDLFEERDRPSDDQLQAALAALSQDYATRGIELTQVASGWRIQVRARYVESVSRLWSERPSKYSRALLETLALVAYRQPITRSEIEEIRGVSISSTIMRTLQERNWIRVVGHREVPGRPELLGTTREFLDYFNLRSLDQLPTLAELKDLESIGVQLELPGNEVSANVAASEDATNVDSGSHETDTAEAPGTEAEVAAGEAGESASVDDSTAEATASDSVDEPELSADAEAETDDADDIDDSSDEGEDADAADEDDDTPTLVASADDERDSGRHVSEPPQEDR
jgi:segregation and condensation protein B